VVDGGLLPPLLPERRGGALVRTRIQQAVVALAVPTMPSLDLSGGGRGSLTRPPTVPAAVEEKHEKDVDDGQATFSESGSSHSLLGCGSLIERSTEMLMQKLGVVLPEEFGDVEECQRRIRSAYKTVIAAYLGTFDILTDAVGIVDLQTGLLLYCNNQMQSVFGFLKRELMFRLITDFLHLPESEKISFLEGLKEILHHGQSQQFVRHRGTFRHTSNVTGVFFDGLERKPVTLEYTASLLKLDASLGVSADCALAAITFRNYEPLYQLALDARVAESVFANCPLAIVRADFFGRILDLNTAALTMFNLARVPTIGQNVSIFMPKSLRASHDHFLRVFREKIKARPCGYSSSIVNNTGTFNSRKLTTVTWDGKDMEITLDVRIIDDTLVAYLRDCNAMVLGDEHRRAQVKNSFPSMLSEKYFASGVPDSKEGLRVAVRNKAVMRIDLVDSTEKFLDCTAEEHLQIINSFLSKLDVIIADFQGVTIKHTGDGVLAIFDPIHKAESFARSATLCAASCLHAAKELSKDSPVLSQPARRDFFSIRVGVGTGDFMVAMVGTSEHIIDVDVIGKVVNLASRLEAATLPNTLAIDHETYQAAKVATTSGPLRGLFSEVKLDAPLKGTTTNAYYCLSVDRLVPEIISAIEETKDDLKESALAYRERLKEIRARL
jgi:class 3 adenylate cyclase/PAS domain-containing protein